MINYFILIAMTLLGAIGAFCLKKASVVITLKDLFLDKNFYLGGILYFISAILNIYLLKCMDYSTVLPLTSITYMWTMILSYYILKENINYRKIIGIISILIGVFFIAK